MERASKENKKKGRTVKENQEMVRTMKENKKNGMDSE